MEYFWIVSRTYDCSVAYRFGWICSCAKKSPSKSSISLFRTRKRKKTELVQIQTCEIPMKFHAIHHCKEAKCSSKYFFFFSFLLMRNNKYIVRVWGAKKNEITKWHSVDMIMKWKHVSYICLPYFCHSFYMISTSQSHFQSPWIFWFSFLVPSQTYVCLVREIDLISNESIHIFLCGIDAPSSTAQNSSRKKQKHSADWNRVAQKTECYSYGKFYKWNSISSAYAFVYVIISTNEATLL